MFSIRGGRIRPDQQIWALPFEINKQYADIDCQTIRHIYATNCNIGFPLGVRMRLVPELLVLSKKCSRENFYQLRNRQAAFLQVPTVGNLEFGLP
jgi:hypothetical protein